MTPDPMCVRTFTSIEDAANLLLRMKIRRLPVVDENGKLMGERRRRAAWFEQWEGAVCQQEGAHRMFVLALVSPLQASSAGGTSSPQPCGPARPTSSNSNSSSSSSSRSSNRLFRGEVSLLL